MIRLAVTIHEDPPGDDLSVRMPLPELRAR
jgi:hypothetical protein